MAASTADSTIAIYRGAYRAAVEGEGDTVSEFYTRDATSAVNVMGDTVLHVLALYCHSEIVHSLLQLPLYEHGLTTKNTKGNIALHEAARVGCVKTAKAMVSKEPGLVSTRNLLGETPVYWAAAFGQNNMLLFLASINGSENGLRRNDGCTLLHAAVVGEYYSLALEIIRLYPDLLFARNEMGTTALHILAESPSSFRSGTAYTCRNLGSSMFIPRQMLAIIIYLCLLPITSNGYPGIRNSISGWIRRFIRWFSCVRKIDDIKQKHNCALKLAKCMIENNIEWTYNIHEGGDPSCSWISGPPLNNSTILPGRSRIEDPLLLATKLGIIELVEKILEEFPDAIEVLDGNGKNLVHLAAEYRQERVFKFLKSKNFPIVRMIGDIDEDGNTPLHLAAKLGDIQPRHVVGAQQQMPWELFWFKSIKRVSPPNFFPIKNSKGKTAEQLFNDTHQNLQKQAEKWSDDTTNSFMVVSTLISTITLTAAFTVPGGYSQESGLPVLGQNKDFLMFLSYISAAQFCSVLTLGMSISAHLSRFQKDDFYVSLPCKFLIAASSLFYSVVYMITSFTEGVILETSGRISPGYYFIGSIAIISSSIMLSLIYIDTMFPVARYLTDVFLHSISNHGQKL